MDPKRIPSPDILPGRLGLTEGEMEIARMAIEQAENEPVPMSHVISGLVTLLSQGADCEEFSLADAITRELREQSTLLHISIAYRAFALGKEVGIKEAETRDEKDQAEHEEDQAQ